MRFCYLFILFFIFESTGWANNAINESWGSIDSNIESFESANALKTKKKLGVGSTVLGATGLVGLNMYVNLNEAFSFSLGYGISRGFNAFNFSVKQALGGKQYIPYVVGGFSRWYSVHEGEGVGQTAPAFFKKKFLNAQERRTGEFAENILYPGIGMEYLNTSGEYRGLGFFGEILYMVDLDDLVAAPTVGFGTAYYF